LVGCLVDLLVDRVVGLLVVVCEFVGLLAGCMFVVLVGVLFGCLYDSLFGVLINDLVV
jgi:hypothetical protein